MKPVVVRGYRLRYAILLLMALGLTALGLFEIITRGRETPTEGWVGTVFFACCVFVFAKQWFDARPRLIINDAGVFDRTLGIGVIPWSEITGAHVRTVARSDFICLEVRDPARFMAPPTLNLSGVKANTRDLLALILKMSAKQATLRP